MITENELRISNESYTHKDFYQIYPEILELVNKITERWDPTSSNESDPGVVLLKLLAFVADKLNYNLDKNILECFMPSATQEDSMRKLCELVGYDMKYYQSAEADVSFMWVGDNLLETPQSDTYILLDRFTQLQDESGEVNFVLTKPVSLTYRGQTVQSSAIQGTLQTLEINDDNLVKLYNLDDKRRLYLPESQIAENGIWVYNPIDSENTSEIDWTKVNNLNTQEPLKPVWKFGFDSKKRLPYIAFPEDISELIHRGLVVKYIRTLGASGNITAKTLTKLTKLDSVTLYKNGSSESVPIEEDGNIYLNIQNNASTTNGSDVETLDQAYNSFKKTIGTFDTLVTCRDYANKIYNLVYSNTNGNNLVSNVQVCDIKDDINLAYKIVSFDDFGIIYSDIPQKILPVKKVNTLPPASENTLNEIYYYSNKYYTTIVDETTSPKTYSFIESSESSINRINNFDIYIYPLLNINSFYKAENYNSSFKPKYQNREEIINQLSDYKTLSHNIKQLDSSSYEDIYAIKNYYHLNAKIWTTYKVSEYESSQILNNIYYALWNRFNARNVDYGEEIPSDEILTCIQGADSRIKFVSLDEPKLKTNVMLPNGNEYTLINYEGAVSTESTAQKMFYKLVAKNVLAGVLPLFNYDKRFDYTIGEVSSDNDRICGKESTYPYDTPPTPTPPSIPTGSEDDYSITAISTEVTIPLTRVNAQTYTLDKNENIQLICPNLTTVKNGLYAAYVNYFFHLQNSTETTEIPCKLTKIKSTTASSNNFDSYLITFSDFREAFHPTDEADWRAKISELQPYQKFVWQLTSNNKYEKCNTTSTYSSSAQYFTTKDVTLENWNDLLNDFEDDIDPEKSGVFYINNSNLSNVPGKLVDSQHNSYKKIQSYSSEMFKSKNLFACLSATQKTHYNETSGIVYSDTEDDTIGKSATASSIPAGTEYQLHTGDKLYINYTDSNDVVHNITYWKEDDKYYKRDDVNGPNTGLPSEFSGILKCNFDLYDSALQAVTGYGKAYSKKSGYSWDDTTVPGMFSLDGQNQIEIRDFVKTQVKQSPFYCYWSVLGNNSNLTLTKIQNSNDYIYEYVLNDDEYFFYTDALKNSLVTLSSGTTIHIVSSTDLGEAITLKLKDSIISLSDIASNGIGAFSDTNWVTLKLNENYYIEFAENQIIGLAEGDTISGITALSDAYTGKAKTQIDNDWAFISEPASVKYNNTFLPKFNLNDAQIINWKIRSLLNLNMNDIEGQPIKHDTNANPVIRKIDLYTSFYKCVDETSQQDNGKYVKFDEGKFKAGLLVEEVGDNLGPSHNASSKLISFTSASPTTKDYSLKSNYPLMQSGGKYLSMHRYTVENTQKDDLYIYAYRNSSIMVKPRGQDAPEEALTSISVYDDDYYKLSFGQYSYYKLPIFVPDGHMAMIMVYYSPSEGVVNFAQASMVDNSNQSIVNSIAFYRDSCDGEISTDTITLTPGINILRIAKSGNLKLATQAQDPKDASKVDVGTLVISDIDIIDISDTHRTGINYGLLNIPKADCKTFVQNYIIDKDLDNLFYYNAPIDKYKELDVNTMNQYSWFNYNNICNKFVIGELDSDFSDINIAKSSRISKW